MDSALFVKLVLSLSGLAALAGLLLILIAPLRRKWLSAPLFRRFRAVLPQLSATEQQALDAGTVGWDGELFSSNPDWQALLATPPARLSAAEQAFLDGPTETLCRMIDDWRITQQDFDLPQDAWEFIKREGFFGMIIPRAYGGLEFSNAAHSAVVMKLATRSITAAVTVMVPNSLGPGKLLLHYGTEEQKNHYLPRLARGLDVPCFALTGPHAGSDAGAIPDTGVVCKGLWKGEEVLGLRLNWDKRYITLGPVATLIGLAFTCHDPDHLLGATADLGITVALVPRDTPGVETGERHNPLNIPFMNGPNRGHDVFVPLTHIVGGETGIGQGWRMLMESLSEGRGISLPALSTGAGKAASRFTGAYARLRQQFNQPIGHFEGVEEALARIAGLTYQMDAARRLTLAYLDRGEKPSVISAIVKYHLTEKYRRVINDAMDVQGGSGICLGPSNLLGRAYQAIPIAITVEGANILTRSMMIFGQGAIRCHPWVLHEFTAMHHPDPVEGLRLFDQALMGHARFLTGNIGRAFVRGLTRGRSATAPASLAHRYYQTLAWMSAALALCSDAAMITLGGSLKRRERLSARLGDVLSELYLSSAVLKRYYDDGEPEADYPLVRWALQDSLYRMQESFRSLYRNLPGRPLAWALRVLTFPTGFAFSEPSDRAAHAAAQLLLSPSNTRDRLTAGVFIHPDANERSHQLEDALLLAHELAPLEARMKSLRRKGTLTSRTLGDLVKEARQKQLIDEAQFRQLERHLKQIDQVVQVDAFSRFGDEQPAARTAASPAPIRKAQP
ncbi:MAG: acyl-CoA dehydrogenase [Hydrogenophilales bacterium 17-61-9]|nr:MAG: acyl-CoA dehydrogenase [Hydrogenophilales bacterium 17-61-9]